MKKNLVKKVSQSCEKAVEGTCKYITENCLKQLPYDPQYMRSTPARRWVDCYGWKATLGLEFISELGIYMLPKCPACGANLIEALKEKLSLKSKK